MKRLRGGAAEGRKGGRRVAQKGDVAGMGGNGGRVAGRRLRARDSEDGVCRVEERNVANGCSGAEVRLTARRARA